MEYDEEDDGFGLFIDDLDSIVVWETLVEYLQSITLDFEMNSDIPLLIEYFNNLDIMISNVKNINLLLSDTEQSLKKNWSFFRTETTKFNAETTKRVHERSIQFQRAKIDLWALKLRYLTASGSQRKILKTLFQKLTKIQTTLHEDLRTYQINAEMHNVFLVGNYLNTGMYPVTDYDCERILLNGSSLFSFEEYSLFDYDYLLIKNSDVGNEFFDEFIVG